MQSVGESDERWFLLVWLCVWGSADFSEPRDFATAMTSFALGTGGTKVLARPDRGKTVTWTAWTCAVRARAANGPYAGRTLGYRCTHSPQPTSGGGTLCGPANPPHVPGVITS